MILNATPSADSFNDNDEKLSQKTYLINPFDAVCVPRVLDAT